MVRRHDDDTLEDPHVVDDRQRLREKIERDGELRVLERPDGARRTSSSAAPPSPKNRAGGEVVTVPPAHSDRRPMTTGGEDPEDPVARARRDKVKEVSFGCRVIPVLYPVVKPYAFPCLYAPMCPEANFTDIWRCLEIRKLSYCDVKT